jgi:Leucine-rich repeat (LRR) protein
MPHEIWERSALTTLRLAHNQIDRLDERVAGLHKLETLILDSNMMPDEIFTISSLTVLSVQESPEPYTSAPCSSPAITFSPLTPFARFLVTEQ